jgi:hypothetical protein
VPGGLAPAGAAGVLAISGNYSTPNPPVGAWITYHVRDALPDSTKLVLTISDSRGAQVRQCQLDSSPGLRRISWNLFGDPPAQPSADAPAAADAAAPAMTLCVSPPAMGRNAPSRVQAGVYRATIGTMTGTDLTVIGPAQTFSVLPLLQ